jgi:DNA repair exonuclease SbcCD ATPase subunit
MADFSTTATQSAARLETLTGALAQLDDGWRHVQGGVQHLAQRVSSDTQTLLGRLETLVSAVHQARETVQEDVAALDQALDEMEGQLAAQHEHATQVFQEAQAELSALEGRLDGLLVDIDKAVQRAEAAMQAFVGRAEGLDAALTDATAHTERHLQESIASATRQHQAEVERAATALHDAIRSTTVPAITAQVESLQTHLDHLVQRLQAKLTEAGTQAQGRTSEVLTRLTQDHHAQLQGLTQQVQTLATALQHIGSLLQTGTVTAVTTTTLLADGARTANMGVELVLGLLRETEDLLRHSGV